MEQKRSNIEENILCLIVAILVAVSVIATLLGYGDMGIIDF